MTKINAGAEEKLTAIGTQAKRAQIEHDIAQQERAEHIARLRALRLAKKATDRSGTRNGGDTGSTAEDEDSPR